jgi:hypothetical protein
MHLAIEGIQAASIEVGGSADSCFYPSRIEFVTVGRAEQGQV